MRDTLSSKLSLNRKFRLFPRPQVKLFGRDRLDISLPPSPHRDEDDYDEYEPPAASPKANRGGRVSAARVCGSPLGQFLQRSLSQLQPLGRALRGIGNPWDRGALQPSYRRFGHGTERAGSVRVGGSRDPPPREPGASRPSSLRNPFINPVRSPSPPPAPPRPGSVRGERPRRSVSFGTSFRRDPPAVPRAPPNAAPPAPASRLSGVSGRPLTPRPSRRSSSPGVSPPGRLPLAWPRQPEPPTKAVKPLMRSSFLAPPSRPGSRRLSPSWDGAPSSELPPWQGTAPPSSPASGPPKSFIQRIGQPLAGMAPRSPPPRPPPAESGGRSPSPGRIRHVGQSLASLIVGSMASSKAPSSPPPARRPLSRSPSPPRRASRRDMGTPGPLSPGVGSPHLSSSPSARRRSPPPRGRPPGSPPVLRRSFRAPEPAESEAVAGEDGAGRYAVVTPQIQRLGSFRRASRMYKQHWSKQHVVRCSDAVPELVTLTACGSPWSLLISTTAPIGIPMGMPNVTLECTAPAMLGSPGRNLGMGLIPADSRRMGGRAMEPSWRPPCCQLGACSRPYSGLICGAITSQYLLEKSRVVFQAKSERNYHIFYEMLVGLPAQQRQRYCLQGAETYYYLNQGGNCEIPGKDDAEDFRRLLNTMEVLGFTVDEQNSIFRILSSVLHLGNVYFEKYETDCQEIATVVSATEIRTVAELLQISPEGLQKAITFKVTVSPYGILRILDDQSCFPQVRLPQPEAPRMSPPGCHHAWVSPGLLSPWAILDCHLAGCPIPVPPNCLSCAMESHPAVCPQATDHTFLQKCHYHHGTNPLYTKPKMPLPEFTIKHYAGKVTYQVSTFLLCNPSCPSQVVANLFFGHAQVLARQRSLVRRSSTRTRRYKAPTVAARFQQSLLDLPPRLHSLSPQEPGLFEADVVSSQLRYSGILETIRIRKEGFPIRIPFFVFIDRCWGYAGWWLWVKHCQLWGTLSRELGASQLGLKASEDATPGNGKGLCQHGGRSPMPRRVSGSSTAPSLHHPHPHPWLRCRSCWLCAAAAREVNAGCVVLVPPPALQPDSQLTLPLDINDYSMAKYVRGHFQVRVAPATCPSRQGAHGGPHCPGCGAAVRFGVPKVVPWGSSGAGCGVTAVLCGAGCAPVRPPSLWVLLSPGATGTPLRLLERDPPSTPGHPTRGRETQVALFLGPGHFVSFLFLFFLLSLYLHCMFPSPRDPQQHGILLSDSTRCCPLPTSQPFLSPKISILNTRNIPLRLPGWQQQGPPGGQVATGAGVTTGAGLWDADSPTGCPAHPAGRGAVPRGTQPLQAGRWESAE
uniref:Myosin motor domain-containing protein n=1 Tax=Coturnix japonica TaxID=93934 RepID=A0A8C2ST33_COTJA